MFGKKGLETSIVKIIFIAVSLVLATVAIKMSYDALSASNVLVNVTGTPQEPIGAIGNLTSSIASSVE